jgi:hypothetical protein
VPARWATVLTAAFSTLVVCAPVVQAQAEPQTPQSAQRAEMCQPVFTPIDYNRSLPYSYFDEALESLPFLAPKHVMLEQQRSSVLGVVVYSYVVYKKDPAVQIVTIEGAAISGLKAWTFSATCSSSDYATIGLTPIRRQLAALGKGEGTDAASNQPKTNAKGYLVLTIKRTVFTGSQMIKSATQTQNFKVALDSTFFSQFTQAPSSTLFYCAVDDRSNGSSLRFLQYFQQAGGKVATWAWGEGAENLNGSMVSVHNGKARMDATFPSWGALDSGDTINVDGGSTVVSANFVDVSIAARYVPQLGVLPGNPGVDDPALQGGLLAPINGVDGRVLVTGDPQDGLSLTARCGFQKN